MHHQVHAHKGILLLNLISSSLLLLNPQVGSKTEYFQIKTVKACTMYQLLFTLQLAFVLPDESSFIYNAMLFQYDSSEV